MRRPGALHTANVEIEVILLKRIWKTCLSLALCLLLAGCGAAPAAEPEETPPPEPEYTGPVVEVGGQVIPVDETLEQSGFAPEDFSTDPETGRVTCLNRSAVTGVDVSSHQGEVDWAAVAGDGIEFAILRIGNRGYSQGGLKQDERFEANYAGAVENGLDVGVYLFSQAVSEEEAVEEAEFVLSILDGRELQLPVVFDWEEINDAVARTDEVDAGTVTACALAFCRRIEEAGYKTAFYCNGMVGYLRYDIARMQHLDAWYAEYGDWPSFAYAFDLWQYSHTGSVAGIAGNVDLNLWFPDGEPESENPETQNGT